MQRREMPEDKCPHCGAPYEGDATFCINCGAKREEPVEGKPGEPPAASLPEKPPPEEEPAAAEELPPAEPSSPSPAPEEEVLERLDNELTEAASPEPKKKSKKGCCVAAVVVGAVFLLLVACGLVLYFTGLLEEWGLVATGGAYKHDFTAVTEEDFSVWQKGKNAVVTQEKGMLKVRDALVGVNFDPGRDYTASCTVFVKAVENEAGWAGLVARVNPKGGERYAFEILPKKKLARIEKIGGPAKPLVLAGASIPALRLGAPFTITAAVSGNELSMEINGTVVCRVTDIGLLAGPMGFEVRGATAYFDDLTVRPE
jgi:hypothetical protein